VPYGTGEENNVEVRSWGEDKMMKGDFVWHDDIARELGGLDAEGAVKMSGARFSVLLGLTAKLERALGQYFINFHTSRGYTEVSVPFVVSEACLRGTGQLPKFEDDLFRVNHKVFGNDSYLIPTAEVPLTNLYREQLLPELKSPIKLTSLSPCFRAEAGHRGRDSRGLLRQHQFHKVELVKICSSLPGASKAEHESMVADVEELLRTLELPYRVVLLCSGDIGFSARICYDIEVWMPAQQKFREISSISNCYEFQARRMGLRMRINKPKSISWPHTINGSGVAIGR
jgi:seryl-tRNA synthetase